MSRGKSLYKLKIETPKLEIRNEFLGIVGRIWQNIYCLLMFNTIATFEKRIMSDYVGKCRIMSEDVGKNVGEFDKIFKISEK